MFTYNLLKEAFGLYEGLRLDDVLVLACQHLLNDQQKAFELLIEAGLKPENCIVVGKNYSANPDVIKALKMKGCVIAPFSTDFDPLQKFDDWFESKLTTFLEQEIGLSKLQKFHKIIILDDGGFMHLAVNKICGNMKNIVGIEQTSSGFHKIRESVIKFPSIPIARTFHKLTLESPFIAQNGYERINRHIQIRNKINPNILVIGLGAIGRQIAGQLFLIHGHRGNATDIKWDSWNVLEHGASQLLNNDGKIIAPVDAIERLGEFDVIIGATGSPVLTNSDINRLHPEVSLISMSSSDREFPAVAFRQAGGEIHDDYWMENRCLVNGGFPITFDGTPQSLPPEQIELTVAMMFTCLLNEASDNMYTLSMVMNRLLSMWEPYCNKQA